MSISDLPALNATLNGTSAILLMIAHNRIKQGKIPQHRALMISAFTVSCLFLISYLYYHANAGVVYFGGTGWVRPVYFILLTTHTILAAAVPVIATITLVLGLRGRYSKHRRIAKWTYPIWLYVSVTGVIIYFLLFQLYTPSIVPL